jgi:YVTN family beta-propeller protein
VANGGSNFVSVISDTTNTVVATVRVGSGPEALADDSGTGEVTVVNGNTKNVSVISVATNSVVATLDVGYYPEGVVYDPGRGEIFVANGGSHNGSVVKVISDSTNSIVATIPVGSQPQALAYDSGKGEVFVTTTNPASVSVLSDATSAVVATVPVGAEPGGLAYDKEKGEILVANGGSNTVSEIFDVANIVGATAAVGNTPSGVAYDSGNGYAYVSNSGGGTISVLSPPTGYTVNFAETGLPLGNPWSVMLSGVTESSSSSSITFTEPNGTYSLLVGDVNGYSASPASGSINVSGSGATQSVVFVLNVPTGDDPGVSPGFLGLPGYDGFYLLAGAVGVAAFVAAVALTAPPRGPKPGPSTPSNR